MYRIALLLTLLFAAAPVSWAQNGDSPATAGKVYRLAPDALDFGEIARPGALRETVYVEGLEYADQLAVESLRAVGVWARPSPPDLKGRRGFDVYVEPTRFDPGAHEDTIAVTINNEEVAQLKVKLNIAAAASAAILKKLTVFAKEGDDYTGQLRGIAKNVAVSQGGEFPDMRYQIDLRLVHEDANKREYDRLLAGAQQQTTERIERAWPAMFLGPRLIAVGQQGVSQALGYALFGQDFAQPKPVVEIATVLAVREVLDTYVSKVKEASPGVVWMPQKVDAAQLKDSEFIVSYPTREGPRAIKGSLAELDATLHRLVQQPLPKPPAEPGAAGAGVMRDPGGITSEGTRIVSGPAPPPGPTVQAAAGQQEESTGGAAIVVVVAALGAVVLVMLVVVVSMYRRYQATMSEVSARLEKL